MNIATQQFIQRAIWELSINRGRVLECGSLNVNGSVREFFKVDEYIGTDMRAGPGVDIVINTHNLDQMFKPEEFDFVICCDMFEHDNAFWISIEQMKSVLKKEGWLVLVAAGFGFGTHNYPKDYWRFNDQSFGEVFFGDMKNVHAGNYGNLAMGWGQKV